MWSDNVFQASAVWADGGVHVPQNNNNVVTGNTPQLRVELVMGEVFLFDAGGFRWGVAGKDGDVPLRILKADIKQAVSEMFPVDN